MTPEELLPLLRQTEQGTTLSCRVQPRASRCRIAERCGDAVKISLNAPPVDGKANAELCQFLAKKAGVPKSSVQVMIGETSRTKVVLFSGAKIPDIVENLCK